MILVDAPDLAQNQVGDNFQLISLVEASNLVRQSLIKAKKKSADMNLVIDPNQFDQGKLSFFP